MCPLISGLWRRQLRSGRAAPLPLGQAATGAQRRGPCQPGQGAGKHQVRPRRHWVQARSANGRPDSPDRGHAALPGCRCHQGQQGSRRLRRKSRPRRRPGRRLWHEQSLPPQGLRQASDIESRRESRQDGCASLFFRAISGGTPWRCPLDRWHDLPQSWIGQRGTSDG
jgi:hypothetical protein